MNIEGFRNSFCLSSESLKLLIWKVGALSRHRWSLQQLTKHLSTHFTGVDDEFHMLIVLLRFLFQDVFGVASRPDAQRAVLKFAR